MFWKYNTSASSQIEALLTKESIVLSEVLDSEEIIGECRGQNKLLIDYLQKPEVMHELVTLITNEPSIELEEKVRFKYPNVACELLTCDVPSLNERLAGDKALLEKLYMFLNTEQPLNPLLASYFSKVMGVLIAQKTEQNWLSYQFTCLQVLDFLKAKDDFIQLLLKHLGTSAVMDLTLKLMTQVEGMEMRQNILNWLDSQRIMQSLVCLLNPKVDKEIHYNVAQLLCDFIRTARDTLRNCTERVDPDPLLNTLESPDTVTLLLDNIFEGERVETAIVGGIQVLLALLDVHQNSYPKIMHSTYSTSINEEASDIEQKQKIINSTSQAICTRIKDFHNLLIEPPKRQPILTTVGMLDPPLGNTRLQVTRLFAALISTNHEQLLREIELAGTMEVLLELFFKYQWNNFLHTQVKNCFISALKTNSSDDKVGTLDALSKHLLSNCKLIQRIIDAWKANDEQQSQERGVRKGYMGHLISMVNSIVDLCSNTYLGQYLKEQLPDVAKTLDEFKDTTLNEVNKIQESLLGGVLPDIADKGSEDYTDVPFPQSTALQQQMYSQYQVQNIAPFIEGYSGINDNTFNDGDETLQTIDSRTDTSFDLSSSAGGDEHSDRQQEMFKSVCAQMVNAFDDGNGDGDDGNDGVLDDAGDHTYRTVIEKGGEGRAGSTGGADDYDNSDSDEELPRDGDEDGGGTMEMDVDPWTSPKPHIQEAVVSTDPWGPDFASTKSNSNFGFDGWADFSSATFDPDFVKDAGFMEEKENKSTTEPSGIGKEVKMETDKEPQQNERTAQAVEGKFNIETQVKSAAGDSEEKSETVPPAQEDTKSTGDVLEPSQSIGGDCSVEQIPTDEEKKCTGTV